MVRCLAAQTVDGETGRVGIAVCIPVYIQIAKPLLAKRIISLRDFAAVIFPMEGIPRIPLVPQPGNGIPLGIAQVQLAPQHACGHIQHVVRSQYNVLPVGNGIAETIHPMKVSLIIRTIIGTILQELL